MPCPNLKFCYAHVTLEHYKKFCMDKENWKNCKFYFEASMTPAQWKKAFEE